MCWASLGPNGTALCAPLARTLACRGPKKASAPERIRTVDLRLRRPLLYPPELLAHAPKLIASPLTVVARNPIRLRASATKVGVRGFEPPTPCAQGRCATRLRHTPSLADSTALRLCVHARNRRAQHPTEGAGNRGGPPNQDDGVCAATKSTSCACSRRHATARWLISFFTAAGNSAQLIAAGG